MGPLPPSMRSLPLGLALALAGCDDGCCGTGMEEHELIGVCDGEAALGPRLVRPMRDWSAGLAVIDQVAITDEGHHASEFLRFDLNAHGTLTRAFEDDGYLLSPACARSAATCGCTTTRCGSATT